jgi:5-methylcytosine-specific restriction endonuclease McrA
MVSFLKQVKVNKKERQIIFEKYDGKCSYCGQELKKGWHTDHIEPIVRDSHWNRDKGRYEATGSCRKPENETLENYNPSCASCNIQKNSYTLEQFRHNIERYVISLNSYSTQYKIAKRYGLICENDIKVEFYFEKIQNENK